MTAIAQAGAATAHRLAAMWRRYARTRMAMRARRGGRDRAKDATTGASTAVDAEYLSSLAWLG